MGSAAMWTTRAAVAITLFLGVWVMLPDAAPNEDGIVIPGNILSAVNGVLELDRYFPVGFLLALLGFDLVIRTGFIVWRLTDWVWKKVSP